MMVFHLFKKKKKGRKATPFNKRLEGDFKVHTCVCVCVCVCARGWRWARAREGWFPGGSVSEEPDF